MSTEHLDKNLNRVGTDKGDDIRTLEDAMKRIDIMRCNYERKIEELYKDHDIMSKFIEDQALEIKGYKIYIEEVNDLVRKATEIVQISESGKDYENVDNMLANSEEMSIKYKDTFKKIDQKNIASINSNHLVKICYKINDKENWNGERFWVNVVGNDDNIIYGLISNNLFNVDWLLGKKICFSTDCIYDYVCPMVEKIEFETKLEGYTTFEFSLEVKNMTGGGYSQNRYDIKSAMKRGIVYPSLDPCIFEIKYPNKDIKGRVIKP